MIKWTIFYLFYSFTSQGEEKVNQLYNSTKSKIEELDRKQDQIVNALIKINIKTKKMTYEIDKLAKEKELLEIGLEKNIQVIKETSAKMSETRKEFVNKFKMLNRFKGEDILKTALMFPKLSQIEKNAKMMGLIAANDIISIQEYFEGKAKLKEKILFSKKKIVDLNTITKDIEQKKLNLESEYKSKTSFLEKIKKSTLFSLSRLEKFKKNKKDSNLNDSGVLDFLTSESLAEKKGKILSPIEGRIIETYGYQEKETNAYLNNSGVFVSASENQPVRSIYQGLVIEEGFVNGLGNFIIIDHGDNYYSVYGNIKKLSIKKGDRLKTGQILASIDHQYIDNQLGLYFELRHYSKVLNPQNWIGGWNEEVQTRSR